MELEEKAGKAGPGPGTNNRLWNRAPCLFHIRENDTRLTWAGGGSCLAPDVASCCQGQPAQVSSALSITRQA